MQNIELTLACEMLRQAMKNKEAVQRYADTANKDKWSKK